MYHTGAAESGAGAAPISGATGAGGGGLARGTWSEKGAGTDMASYEEQSLKLERQSALANKCPSCPPPPSQLLSDQKHRKRSPQRTDSSHRKQPSEDPRVLKIRETLAHPKSSELSRSLTPYPHEPLSLEIQQLKRQVLVVFGLAEVRLTKKHLILSWEWPKGLRDNCFDPGRYLHGVEVTIGQEVNLGLKIIKTMYSRKQVKRYLMAEDMSGKGLFRDEAGRFGVLEMRQPSPEGLERLPETKSSAQEVPRIAQYLHMGRLRMVLPGWRCQAPAGARIIAACCNCIAARADMARIKERLVWRFGRNPPSSKRPAQKASASSSSVSAAGSITGTSEEREASSVGTGTSPGNTANCAASKPSHRVASFSRATVEVGVVRSGASDGGGWCGSVARSGRGWGVEVTGGVIVGRGGKATIGSCSYSPSDTGNVGDSSSMKSSQGSNKTP